MHLKVRWIHHSRLLLSRLGESNDGMGPSLPQVFLLVASYRGGIFVVYREVQVQLWQTSELPGQRSISKLYVLFQVSNFSDSSLPPLVLRLLLPTPPHMAEHSHQYNFAQILSVFGGCRYSMEKIEQCTMLAQTIDSSSRTSLSSSP
jgi:hypothetical protein